MKLDEIQRTMLHAVQQPLTATEHMRPKTRDGKPLKDLAESIIKPNDRLTSFERLEIYNRQYWFRLLSALAEDFPGLRGIIGEKRFEKLAIAYLVDCPSRSFTLRDLGSRLEIWLKDHLQFVPKVEHIAVDMVRLEWAEIEAFDGAERPVMTAEDIARMGEDPKLELQPYIRLLDLAYPVDDLLISICHGKSDDEDIVSNAVAERTQAKKIRRASLPKPKKTHVVVHRQEGSVYFKRVEPEAFALLKAIARGESLSEAVAAADWGDQDVNDIAAHIREWFANWASLGWFCHG